MNCKQRTAVLLMAGLWLGLGAARAGTVKRRQAEGPAAGPLVRLDLLVPAGAVVDAAVVRDPFHAGSAVSAPAVKRSGLPKAAAKTAPAAPARAKAELDLAYVGFIRGGNGLAAMVVVAGKTYTVAQGEEVIPGYRVVNLTEDQIEVESSDSVRKTYNRQGDRS